MPIHLASVVQVGHDHYGTICARYREWSSPASECNVKDNLLLEYNFGGALGVEAVAALVGYDGGHALAHGVERVDAREGLLGVSLAHVLVALAQRHHEAQQGTLRLVAHLHRRARRVLRWLQ